MKNRSKRQKLNLIKSLISGEQPIETVTSAEASFEVWIQDRDDENYFTHGDLRLSEAELKERVKNCKHPNMTFYRVVYESKIPEWKSELKG